MASLKGAALPSLFVAILGFTLIESVEPAIPVLVVLFDFLAMYVGFAALLVSLKEYFLGGRA